jgi:cholesterol oxidase
VLEAGRRWGAADFPRTSWNLRRWLHAPRLGLHGIQRLTLLDDVLVLSGAGVGGGSLVYANVLHEPQEDFWRDAPTGWREELAPHFAAVRRMLGAAPVPSETPADAVLRAVGEALGGAETFRPTEVAVHFGAPGELVPDPLFGGEGPPVRGCLHCGACMTGCRHEAKHTLDRTYLHLAERRGAEVRPEHRVTDLRPVAGGWELVAERPGVRPRPQPPVRAAQVVLAAGTLGTNALLLALRERGRLPGLSPRLGERVRTNSEAIVGATTARRGVDLTRGVAITSSLRLPDGTHLQPVRYGRGSNAMGLLGTVLVDGGGRIPRPFRFALTAARHPLVFLRSLSVRRWSERTVILLAMQARDNALALELRRGRLRSRPGGGEPVPTWIPAANEAARHAARALGGHGGSALNEVLLDRPTTAHLLGGACVGAGPEEGVVDRWHRVWGHPGLHVLDGAAVGANPGPNPALTIAAQAERACAHWPRRGEPDRRPPQGGVAAR